MIPSFYSVFFGLFFLTLLFLFCLVLVIGAKTVYIAVKNKLPSKKTTTQEPIKKAQKRTVKKPVRNIEINPEEINRIYVKKSS